ncbi:hypothetical protein OH687_19505 [Burkholderia anthina]|nr:hypothetical protein OH687_19505 [Burkholderia anthina]
MQRAQRHERTCTAAVQRAPGRGSGTSRRTRSAAIRVCPYRANPAGQARR